MKKRNTKTPVAPAEKSPRQRLIESFVGWCRVNHGASRVERIRRVHLQFDGVGAWSADDERNARDYCEPLSDADIAEQIAAVRELTIDIPKENRT